MGLLVVVVVRGELRKLMGGSFFSKLKCGKQSKYKRSR